MKSVNLDIKNNTKTHTPYSVLISKPKKGSIPMGELGCYKQNF